MKKIIFSIILCLAILGVQAQVGVYPRLTNKSVAWDSIRIPVTDTTVIDTTTGNISQFMATVNFKMTGLDSSVIVHPGGSDGRLSTTVWDFHPFRNDSLPYTITRLKWVKTVNGVSQNERSFPMPQAIGHYHFGFYLKNSGCTPTTKYLKYQFLYYKP
jgi:hypothetical protein